MITNGQKTSFLIPSQLPEFIRDNPDYDKFVSFLQAYYEWMEQTGNVTERTKNILNYKDIDRTSSEFLDYYVKEFLPYFPKDSLISADKAVKIAKQLYQSKGTPASFKFLFRVLYDSDFEYYNTKDSVLRASDGKWYVAKSLKLATTDDRFLSIKNYRIIGETSKSIAVIENSNLVGNKTEVFISNIERLFQSGEMVRVVDINNQDVIINNETLRAKLVGQISQVRINSSNRGLLYQTHDPVILYDGLNPDIEDVYDATAEVATTTTGTIQNINVLTGGYGYTVSPNTSIDILNGGGAAAFVASIDPDTTKRANLAFISSETINLKKNYTIGAANYNFTSYPNANANTVLSNALSLKSFSTYPISSVVLTSGGGGLATPPSVIATSSILTDNSVYNDLKNLGILGPIQIASGGLGYVANDKIVFSGGHGYGAHANVKTVAANGMITSVEYVYTSQLYPPGGLDYKSTELPTLSIVSANAQAYGANLYVPSIIGDGATFETVVDKIGAINTINIIDPGEDYVGTPNVSLKVQDIVVSNVNLTLLPAKNDVIFQGVDANTFTYIAKVNNVSLLSADVNPELSLYNLRVFEYTGSLDATEDLQIDGKNINMVMYNAAYDANYDSSGVRTYGDGKAKANASFLNGLVVSQGQYLTAQGQPSSFSVLQSENYNNFTYQITVEKELSKYKEILLNLLHPTGMKMLGRYALKSNTNYAHHTQEALFQGHTLFYYTNDAASNVTMQTDFTNKSTNIIKFNNIGVGTNIAEFIFANSTLELSSEHGSNVRSDITSIDYANNLVTITSNSWLTFMNVAYVTASAGANQINITSLTGAYDIMNNGNYSDANVPLMDIVYAGDRIKLANNNVMVVQSVDYENGIITTANNLIGDANSLLSVSRTFTAGGTEPKQYEVKIYGPIGTQYYPQLTTENGLILTTEDGRIILLG